MLTVVSVHRRVDDAKGGGRCSLSTLTPPHSGALCLSGALIDGRSLLYIAGGFTWRALSFCRSARPQWWRSGCQRGGAQVVWLCWRWSVLGIFTTDARYLCRRTLSLQRTGKAQ